MILIIDNYDSFTYNLNDYLLQLGQNTLIRLNDKIDIKKIIEYRPKAVLISPGPCGPEQAKISNDAFHICYEKDIPLLGICLGMQVIGYQSGAKIIKAKQPMHGKISTIKNNGQNLFQHLPEEFKVTRYHSLVIDESTLSDEYSIDARSEDNHTMAISHKTKKIFGLQYHPESICSQYGLEQLKNFVQII